MSVSGSSSLTVVRPPQQICATVKAKLAFFFLGLLAAPVLLIGAFLSLAYFQENQSPLFREQRLPSGRIIKVTSFLLAWGVEHNERFPEQDSLSLDYVSSVPGADSASIDQEAIEVFELVRPASEQWGFKSATLSAFPSTTRKGQYYIFAFKQAPNGSWFFQRSAAKVHIND